MATVAAKTLRLSLAAATLSVCSLAAEAAKKEALSSVADLSYGVTLYHYFQNDYFNALSELYVAKERGGIQGHGDNPAIIEGGISLAFGMHNTASDLFNELLADESKPTSVKNAAWLNLSKLAYQRSQWSTAAQSLANLDAENASHLVNIERLALQTNIHIHQDDLQAAEDSLNLLIESKGKKDPTAWPYYLHHNLASAYGRNGNFSQAISHYQSVYAADLTEYSLEPDLQLALRDKAHTAAGFSHLALNEYEAAQAEFNQVRLVDGLSNQALLGSGWAAYGQEVYGDAIRPWQELLRRSLFEPEVQEASLALPFAYEKMGAQGEALLAYLDAENTYESELDRIDAATGALSDIALLPLLNIEVDRNSNWLNTPELVEAPIINYLQRLVTRNQFQARVQELRDMQALIEELTVWEQKLTDYQDLNQARTEQRAQQDLEIQNRDYDTVIQTLAEQKATVDTEISRIRSEEDYFALATDPDTLDLIKRAKRSKALAEKAGDLVSPRKQAQAKLYWGILYWQQSQNFHDNLWTLEQQRDSLALEINTVKDSFDRVMDASHNAPDIIPMQQRLDQAEADIAQKQDNLTQLLATIENELRTELLAELEQQKLRVRFYLAETKLSIARLYDTRPIDGDLLIDTNEQETRSLPEVSPGSGNSDINSNSIIDDDTSALDSAPQEEGSDDA